MPTPYEALHSIADELKKLADQLRIDGQGADTLPAGDTAARVYRLAVRAQDIAESHGPAWATRSKAK